MKLLLPSVHSLPELNGLSKEDKKHALKACKFIPFKSWKVWFSLLSFFFVPMAAKATSILIIIFAGINSRNGVIATYSAAQIVFSFVAYAILMRVYIPVIRVALQNYVTQKLN